MQLAPPPVTLNKILFIVSKLEGRGGICDCVTLEGWVTNLFIVSKLEGRGGICDCVILEGWVTRKGM